MRRFAGFLIFALFPALLQSEAALGFDGPTTHAGLTEQGAVTARLGDVLARRWGWRRGLFHRLALHAGVAGTWTRTVLLERLQRVSSGTGWILGPKFGATALGWLTLGSVVEGVPARRVLNHFLDPATGRGLDDTGHQGLKKGFGLASLASGEATFSAFVTGAASWVRGPSAVSWAMSPRNRLGLKALRTHLVLADTASSRQAREHHAAMALVCAGALAHLLQDMASPSHVHGDFLVSHFQQGGRYGSGFETYVSAVFGRYGLSRFSKVRPVRKERLRSFFVDPRGSGLAQFTAAHFASQALLPVDVRLGSKAFRRAARRLPPHEAFDWQEAGKGGTYLHEPGGRYRIAAYELTPEGLVRFWFDRRVYADMARLLLPKAVAYTAGLLAWLFRGRLDLRRRGQVLAIRLQEPGLEGVTGKLVVVVQARRGRRRTVFSKDVTVGAQGRLTEVRVPSGRAIAVFAAQDRFLVARGQTF